MADTRAQILEIAGQEFSRRGYVATSVQRIAARLGLTKTAVLYHFPEKADLLYAIAEPLLEQLEGVVARAEKEPHATARWTIIEGVLDATIEHRELLRMSLKDLALSAATFDRYRDAMLRANELVAGTRPSFSTRVRSAQALAAIGDPVVLYADDDLATLRKEVLEGVHLLLAGAPRPERRRGRKPSLSAEELAQARALAAEGLPVDQIARRLGVSRATAYRYI
ncbi:MAG: TetR family transcriptional regulator [Archangium sp.]